MLPGRLPWIQSLPQKAYCLLCVVCGSQSLHPSLEKHGSDGNCTAYNRTIARSCCWWAQMASKTEVYA